MGAEVRMEGPLFDGRFAHMTDQFVEDVTWEVAGQGSANVHQNADGSFKNPTPYYETQIMVERRTPARVDVHDRGVIYGPWLEGVGTMNQLTRFKGYRIWRRAAQELERQLPSLVNPILQQYLSKVRGNG